MGCSAIKANSAGPISRSANQSGLRTLTSGSRDPKARAAAVRIEVREGNPLASIQELSNISGSCGVTGFTKAQKPIDGERCERKAQGRNIACYEPL